MAVKEAAARIKINKHLEAAGWRFFPDEGKPANIQLEPNVKLKKTDLDALGNDFDKTKSGFVDFLLLDDNGFPLIVLEAKAESKNPLAGKEQARRYARSLNCRFVLLSNGNLHYFWDIDHGNPHIITNFPEPHSVGEYNKFNPDHRRLVDTKVADDYIVLTQKPNYKSEMAQLNELERKAYIHDNQLRFLREYQLKAIHALQRSVDEGNDRFLFEMATGTGKTLTSAAVIKLFLRSGNARRVLFLVDRLELEDQALKAFKALLTPDYQTVIYKENRDDWRRAEIVVTTVQSLLFNNKYQGLFSPTDFDLVISDEAHRSISGNARAVFEYFVGYKLGLTATPKDYLKNITNAKYGDPREFERRQLLDTYRTFGCERGHPTYRYSLLDGVRDGYLVSPTVVDARTDITTALLSEKGFVVQYKDETGDDQEEAFKQREFEKRFFAEATNQLLCKTFLENALVDPVSKEIGKSIVFSVSQNHAAKITQILNQMADRMFPGKYNSDFAVQVTSHVPEAQQHTINFANNKLLGEENFIPAYKTSKTRVCVTVGMMTTGYDCTDILNLALFRPIFSPQDFIQIKGRGTRRHNFLDQLFDESIKDGVVEAQKTTFKLFDFFANCEYFEEVYDYDEVIKLPKPGSKGDSEGEGNGSEADPAKAYEYLGADLIAQVEEVHIGDEGMKIDRMFFKEFEEKVRDNDFIVKSIEAGQWDRVIDYVNREFFEKTDHYYSLDKLRKAADVDRRLSLQEILEKIFGLIPRFKSKDELLEEEFAKFVAESKPDKPKAIPAIKNYFKAYVSNDQVRHIIENRQFTELATNPYFTTRDYKAVPEEFRRLVPEYIKDNVPINKFIA